MTSVLDKKGRKAPEDSPFWAAHVHADRRPFLTARGRIVAALRSWFDAEGFTEVEAAALQVSPGNEAHLHAFATTMVGTDGEASRLYLHTSPEFSLKKLLAAGETQIFEFARVFRNRERSALHHPEFTLLEWYRAGEPYEVLMEDCAEILQMAAAVTGKKSFSFRGCECDPFAEPERMSVADAFARFVSIEVMRTLPDDPASSPHPDLLRVQAEAAGVHIAADDTWSDMFSRILTQRIEPHLGIRRPVILFDYPSSEAALARRKPSDLRVAERFELYCCGVELANAFSELTDPVEQRSRFEADMAEKQRIYGERYPVDEDFLNALEKMPPASGCALGIDRLVMLATGATRIEQVIWTPLPEEGTSL
jgi:lysyl-tRNA synthetase class 2